MHGNSEKIARFSVAYPTVFDRTIRWGEDYGVPDWPPSHQSPYALF